MSHQYSEQVEVVLGRSSRAEGFVATAALATAALVAGLPLAIEAHVAALLWIGHAALRALGGLRPGRRVRIEHDRTIEVAHASGTLRDGSFAAPWLTVVRWRPHGAWRDRSLLIAPDMLGAEDFRRLRVLLRWSAS